VLDISKEPYKLIEPVSGTEGAYAALSYQWGGWAKFTTSMTLELSKKEIKPDSMPIVFQELATIAQTLGIHYLWIDSVCIVQDDDDDWREEAAKMANIYEHASIVIAASCAPNPGTPILGKRSTPAPRAKSLATLGSRKVFMARKGLTCGIHANTNSKPKDPLDQRGWALQEKELARRWFSYSAAETQWRCRTLQTCECCTVPSSSQAFLWDSARPIQELHDRWHVIVQEYTSRKLTQPTDKFPALIGVANKFRELTQATYLAGLWKENIVNDLAWKRGSDSQFYPPPLSLAPSFSWASISGMVSYQPTRSSYSGTRTYHAQLIGSSASTAQGGSFAIANRESKIILRGCIIDGTLSTSDAFNPSAYYLEVQSKKCISGVYFGPDKELSGCEFTVDTILEVQDDTNEEDSKNGSVKRLEPGHNSDLVGAFTAKPVKLLALDTFVTDDTVYENFLILGRDRRQGSSYHRIGLGTGKSCKLDSYEGLVDSTYLFLWTLKEKIYQTAGLKDVSTEDICIL